MKKLALAIGTTFALFSLSSLATNDGSLASGSSTGDLDITVEIPDLVQISGLNNIDLGTFSGSDLSGEDQVCVYRNGSGDYEITFTAGSNNGAADAAAGVTAYELESSAGDTIAYTVDFEDSVAGAYTDTDVGIGSALTGQSGDDADATCGSGSNAKVRVNVAATEMESSPAGDYVGTLYMTVSPE